jgi:signal transduction histidine kinase
MPRSNQYGGNNQTPLDEITMSDRNKAASSEHFLWLPFALIATALVLMLTAPVVIGTRVQSMRQHEGNVIAPALVWVNDLEAAIGAETAARSEAAERTADSSNAERSADAAEAKALIDRDTLAALIRDAGPTAVTLLENAGGEIASWQRDENRFSLVGRNEPAIDVAEGTARRSERWKSVQNALAGVQRLDDNLGSQSSVELAEISRLERFNDFVPVVLVPFALLGLAALGWAARRTRQLSREASAGRAAAEQALASKSALMRGVTHDLKNPLGAARGYADLLTEGVIGPVAPRQADILKRLMSLIDVTLDTLNDLVELSRADAGMLSVDAHDTDVAALTREVVDDYTASGKKANVDIAVEIADEISASPILKTDSSRVRQVLGNLLSNSFKYASANHLVRVSVKKAMDAKLHDVVLIQVADNGPGVPPELHEQVFEEFFRVPSVPGSAKGSGVGLAIARRVARLIGGDLRLEDTKGGGATFTLLLPLARTKSA